MLVTLDFETYFDTKVSSTKMTTMEYVKHPMFKVWGVGIKIMTKLPSGLVKTKPKKHSTILTGARRICCATTRRLTATS